MATRRQVVAGGIAAGCGLAPARRAAAQPATIVMWSFLDPARTTGREIALRQMIESFEAANPSLRVRVEPQVFSELMAKFLASHATGGAPDIIWVNTENMGALVRSGAALDLESAFLSRWTAEQKADFFVRAGFDAGLSGTRRFAVPLFHATTSIGFRRDLFTAAGIDPARIRTWDQLAEAAVALTAIRDGRVETWGFGTPLSTERTGGTTAITFMLQAAGPIWENCRPRYAGPAGQRAVQWHIDMITRLRAMPREVISNHTDDITDQFIAGRYAMAVIPFARYEHIARTARWGGENLGVLPWPNWTEDRPGPQQVQGWYAAVWARSPRAAHAARFLEHMISPDAVRLWTRIGGQVPTRASVWAEPEFRDAKYAYLQTVVDGWKNASFVLPPECNTARLDADWNQAVHRALVGNVPVVQALQEAERSFLSRQ